MKALLKEILDTKDVDRFVKCIKQRRLVSGNRLTSYFLDYFAKNRTVLDPPNCSVSRNYKISICTNVMNKLGDIKQTLPKNIKDNSDYKNIEFVLLNYNSTDGLDEWVRSDMMNYIEDGILNYFHTADPEYYDMCHSRNVVFKVSQGDIILPVDADNFTSRGFATCINMCANLISDKETAVFCAFPILRGRVGLFKKFFMQLGGYDEELMHRGYQDRDMQLRAVAEGAKCICFTNRFYRNTNSDSTWSREEKMKNYPKHLRSRGMSDVQAENKMKSWINLIKRETIANNGKHWGKAKLIKNFVELLEV
ncbi:MAG: glycosyltransferase family A protein [Candidatus Hodarchaeales archaeon]